MRLSILINNYNYADYLSACIDSALAQTYSDLEIIVVDDGSTDGSRAILAGYGDAVHTVLKENGGQASSFNAGFAASSGDVVMLLDSDDAFLPGKATEVAKLMVDSALGWCFDHVTTDPDARIADKQVVRAADYRTSMREGRFPHVPIPTSGLSFRRDLLSQVFPMPTARDVVLSDNYLKFAATFLSPGIVVESPLTFQRIHGANRYTGANMRHRLDAQIMVATGAGLAQRYVGIQRISRHLIAGGVAQSELPILKAIPATVAAASAAGLSGAVTCTMMLGKRLASCVRPTRH
jgi:glycosyltransferase involved in cell wall biosynthesis